ncbi:MAG: SGNH/GDSL hydrolase family protein [Pseudomonadota bacterium]
MRAIFLLFAMALTACTPSSPPADNAILAIGDSVMAWNGGEGIPEVTGAALGRPVVDASVSGARLSTGSVAGALGFEIGRQVPGPGWDWIIVTGGGNDIRPTCREAGAETAQDALIGPDLTGEIPALIARLRDTGAKVAFVGYYDGAEASPTGFAPCQPYFTTINRRLTALSSRDPGLIFLDAGDVIDPADRGLYDRDLIHPSPRGSAQIGAALADAIRAAEGR